MMYSDGYRGETPAGAFTRVVTSEDERWIIGVDNFDSGISIKWMKLK